MNTQSLKYNNNTLVSFIVPEQARHCNVAHPCFSPRVFFYQPYQWNVNRPLLARHLIQQNNRSHHIYLLNKRLDETSCTWRNYFTHFIPLRLGEFPLPSNNIMAHMSCHTEGEKWSLSWDYEGVIIILQSLFHSSKPVHFCFISGWALIFGASLVTFIFILYIIENVHKLGITHKQKINCTVDKYGKPKIPKIWLQHMKKLYWTPTSSNFQQVKYVNLTCISHILYK